MIELRDSRILVTGGTGFIGGRLIEHLVLKYGADVHALIRNFARAPRIARFSIKMFPGDVTDPEAVDRAVENCDIVFHCAYGSAGGATQQKRATVKGIENVLKASLKHKVKRVVHVSTISVYGKTEDGCLDESAPRRYSKQVYADSKLEAEKFAFSYYDKFGLPVSIIQPTIVFGPFGRPWTLNPINQLKKGRVILVEGGDGLCNAVYVDDVVQAMILAATRDEAVGQAFLISAVEPVTWREFYGAYERMLGIESTIPMSLSELGHSKQRHTREPGTIAQVRTAMREHPYILDAILELPAVARTYGIAQAVTPAWLQRRIKVALLADSPGTGRHPLTQTEKPVLPLTPSEVDFFRAHTRVRIDKARRLLGYEPAFDLEKGMKLTEMWVRYSGLA